MFTTGGTGGGAGSPGYNLSLAQFQQKVATAEINCRKCYPGCKGSKYCKKLVCCQFGLAQAAEDNCCEIAKQDLSSCSSQRSCRNCPCRSSSSSSTTTVVPVPVEAARSLRSLKSKSKRSQKSKQ